MDKRFSVLQGFQTSCGQVHPAPYTMDTGAVPVVVRWSGDEVDHSPRSSAELRKEWSYLHIYASALHVTARHGQDEFVFTVWHKFKEKLFLLYLPMQMTTIRNDSVYPVQSHTVTWITLRISSELQNCLTFLITTLTFQSLLVIISQYHCNLSEDIQQSCLTVTNNGR